MAITAGGTFQVVGAVSVSNAITSTGSVIRTQRGGLTTTSTDGAVAENTTASTSGAPVQYSSRTRWTGTGWTGAASQVADWICETRPINGSSPITSDFVTSAQINAGGYNIMRKDHSTGGFFLANQTAIPTTPTGGIELYPTSGATTIKGSGGTITTIAPA